MSSCGTFSHDWSHLLFWNYFVLIHIVLMNNKVNVSKQTCTTIHSVGVGEIGKPGTVHLYICTSVLECLLYVYACTVCIGMSLHCPSN